MKHAYLHGSGCEVCTRSRVRDRRSRVLRTVETLHGATPYLLIAGVCLVVAFANGVLGYGPHA